MKEIQQAITTVPFSRKQKYKRNTALRSDNPKNVLSREDPDATQSEEIRVITDLTEIEEIRAIWSELYSQQVAPHPYIDIDIYPTHLNCHTAQSTLPYIIEINSSDKDRLLLIGYNKELPFNPRIGNISLNILKHSCRCLHIPQGGFLGKTTRKNAESFMNVLKRISASRTFDWIYLSGIPTDSDLFSLCQSELGWASRDHASEQYKHFTTSISSVDSFYNGHSRKARYNLRRLCRMLEEEFKGDVSVSCFREPRETATFAADAESIACNTYQRGLQVGLQSTSAYRELWKKMASLGRFCSYVLYIGKRPVAFLEGSISNGTYFVQNTGYLNDFRSYSPGTYLLLNIVEDLCNRGGTSVIDLSRGEEKYKRFFGNKCFNEVDFRIFSPSFRGLEINCIRTLTSFFAMGMRSVLIRLNRYEQIKRRWRERVRATQDRTHSGS